MGASVNLNEVAARCLSGSGTQGRGEKSAGPEDLR